MLATICVSGWIGSASVLTQLRPIQPTYQPSKQPQATYNAGGSFS